jgi:adenosylmethionine-8-amino-7-oxononanoate aminotransferase
MQNKVWLPYTQMQSHELPIHVSHTDKSRIYLKNGGYLVDGIASWWTACHGYRHPLIEEYVIRQFKKMPHVMLGGIIHDSVITLANKITELTPSNLEHVFFSESGSVSVEVALKMAIQYQMNKGESQKNKFIAFRHGYHGDTFAAMSICDPEEGMHAKFSDTLLSQYIVDLPEQEDDFIFFEQQVKMIHHNVAAMIIEPLVQAAGGMFFHSSQILQRVVEICRSYNILIIFDEIATGFGRTGSMFAFEKTNIVPDIFTLSKALTGGSLPLAATVASKEIFNAFLSERQEAAFMHGPTYSGNPTACSAALGSIEVFAQEPRLEQATSLELRLKDGLSKCSKLAIVRDVRIFGAIGVVELAEKIDIARLKRKFIDQGVWIRPIGKIVYLMPALNITDEDLEKLCDSIFTVLNSIR